jgi:hypothetical protein
MDNPPYLVDQYAAQCGLSANMAKRSMLLKAYAAEGKAIKDAAKLIGISRSSAIAIARKMIIDFSDYRPYAAKEKKGEARPDPFFRDTAQPASSLPLFA